MCLLKLSEYSCGHVEKIHLNKHCTCPLLFGVYEAKDVLCPMNCGSPMSPIAFRSMLGMAADRSQVLNILPWEKHEARNTTQRKQWATTTKESVESSTSESTQSPSRLIRTFSVLQERESSVTSVT